MAILGKKSVLEGVKLDLENRIENIFKKLYEDQKKNVWFPEELNIQQDVNDYTAMTDQERKLFNELVGYFVGTELLVQNVLGESFYPLIGSPRAKMGMSVQMFMEAIHEDFFEMVLNTFNMDKEKMYRIADENPLLLKKRTMVADAADHIGAKAEKIDPNNLEHKKMILYAILVNNILQEGIFFYSAFTMFFAIRESGRMKNVCNGIDLVLIDESLHLQMGIELILGIVEETPEILEDLDFVRRIQETMIEGVQLEIQFLKQQFDTGITFNLNYKEMEAYLKYVADRRMEELGFNPHYGVSENPLQFLEKQDVMTLQNFFEVTPNQYTNY